MDRNLVKGAAFAEISIWLFCSLVFSCRFSHTLFCATFFGISLANFASFIGDLTLEVPTMKYDQRTSNFRQSCLALSITYSVFGVALTLLPRHPDVRPVSL
jgi:hypothetical protein